MNWQTTSLRGSLTVIGPDLCLRQFGVPPGGAWDQSAQRIAQFLAPGEALEIATTTWGGQPFWEGLAEEDLTLGLAGLDGWVEVAGRATHLPARVPVPKGTTWRVFAGNRGMRLAVGIAPGLMRQLRVETDRTDMSYLSYLSYLPIAAQSSLQVEVGVNQSPMGIWLKGGFHPSPALNFSEPSVCGAIQVVEGALLVHGPSGPVTSGYPKIGFLTHASIFRLAQARPGDQIVLRPTTMEEARQAHRLMRDELERKFSMIRLLGVVE